MGALRSLLSTQEGSNLPYAFITHANHEAIICVLKVKIRNICQDDCVYHYGSFSLFSSLAHEGVHPHG